MKEIWKDVIGYEGLYSVSNHGRVKSLPRLTTRGKILKLFPVGRYNKYLQLSLYKNGIGKIHKVHRLVLFAFRGSPSEGMEGSHIDDDTLNCYLSNLIWETKIDNMKRTRNRRFYTQGRKNGNSKIEDKDIYDINLRYASGELQKDIAKSYGITQPTISGIVNRKSWRHING